MRNKELLTIITMLLSFSYSILCMEQYQYDCKQIVEKHNKKLETYKTNVIHKDLNQESIIVREKLLSYKNNLLVQKQKALNNIKEQHHIDDTAWESCMLRIKDVEVFNKTNQSLPLPNVHHDATIPEGFLLLIKKKLNSYNVNPQRVNIQARHNKPYLYASEPAVPSHITRTYPGCSDNTESYDYRLLSENVTPATLSINLDLFSLLSEYSKAALCIRMVEDIVQNGSLISSIISAFEPLLTQQPGAIINSPQFKTFSNVSNKLSVLLPSLHNPIIAACMLHLNINTYSPEFTTHDYNLLSKIEKKWNIMSWISEKINLEKEYSELFITKNRETKK